jgi:isoleucyl-tRNA synthetase
MELKETLLFPATAFEMRGNLTVKEPLLLAQWDQEKLYEKMNANRAGCEEFLLHDGPPYANGDIHCGHMLNRLLKDFVIRSKNMEGYKTPFVFGWDTHGLPIEVKVTKSGVNRKAMSVAAFRSLCHDYALKQVEHQKGQIHRLGCLGDYAHPYLTLLPEYEARQIDVFASMALKGLIYKGVKPVYWSPSSESALAEAEVEYQDVTAKTMYVAFDFADGLGVVPNSAKIIIWTTTPWTIPADLAVTLNPAFEYGLFRTEKGDFVFLCSLRDKLQSELGFKECALLKSFHGQDLEGASVHHPLYPRLSKVICAAFVTEDSGTGCVHTAPDHGLDDFNACLKYGIKPFCPVDERGYMHLEKGDPCDGKFYEEANDIVIQELKDNGHLLKEVDIVHSYPHDWRTHKPVIFRATPQWFCSIEPIREQLLQEIHAIQWEPAWGEEKMVNMIKDRSDWCISRQRVWGVPLPIIYCEDDTPIVDAAVFKHIRDLIAKNGSNAWFELDEKALLPEGYANAHSPHGKFRKETDIMDVWFDSGSSWNGVLKERGLSYPADLYLEGNDQYRGWFNASLILSTAVNGVAPFKKVVTHGWVMDENWQKMSKSAGNGIDPSKVANQYGADILRLWAATVNYETDVRISESIIASVSETYRKIRNTFKFLLGNLQNGQNKPYVCPAKAPALAPIDEAILAELEEVRNGALTSYDAYDFASVASSLTNFLVELSSFYLDYAKDILYCEDVSSARREAVQYVFYQLARELCLFYNPILPFTMEEVYKNLPLPQRQESPQLEDFPKASHDYDPQVLANYESFLKLKDQVNKALEAKRAEGLIGSSSEARLFIAYNEEAVLAWLSQQDAREVSRLFGVSQCLVKPGEPKIEVTKAEGEVCARCRLAPGDVIATPEGPLCARCRAVLKEK